MDKLRIEVSNSKDMERLVLITTIGLLESIEQGLITIVDSQRAIFTPHTAERLQELGFNPEIIELVKGGCLLEDFDSILPEKFESEIIILKSKAAKLLAQLKDKERSYDWWII